jgi:hypothetical protein
MKEQVTAGFFQCRQVGNFDQQPGNKGEQEQHHTKYLPPGFVHTIFFQFAFTAKRQLKCSKIKAVPLIQHKNSKTNHASSGLYFLYIKHREDE